MGPEYFIGIDISKVTLDICIVNVKGDQIAAYKTANTESSIADILGVIATSEFEWISCPKKFASYCGVAPFQLKSGTSLNARASVQAGKS